MEYRDSTMSLINRPDERRREEARIARASQAKPLAEPEPVQAIPGDNKFSPIAVPNSQQDDISRSIMEILGPYRKVLGGPTSNGIRTPRTAVVSSTGAGAVPDRASAGGVCSTADDEGGGSVGSSSTAARSTSVAGPGRSNQPLLDTGQPSSREKQSSSSSVVSKTQNSSSAGDLKRPSTLPVSLSTLSSSSSSTVSSSSSCKPSKPSILPTPPGGPTSVLSSLSSSNQVTVSSSSSPLAPVLSPYNSKDGPVAPKDSQRAKERTPPPPSLTAKLKTSLASYTSTRSPNRDAPAHQSSSQPQSSKSKSSSHQSLPLSRDRQRSASPAPSQGGSQNIVSSASGSTSQPSPAQQPPVSSSSASLSHKHSTSPAHTSPSYKTKASASPAPRPGSTTPTKTSARLPNGVTTQHSKSVSATNMISTTMSSSSNTAKSKTETSAPSVGTSLDNKNKSLKLMMPNETKPTLSKSCLNDIFKEMTELHEPHTAIETPQKAGDGFSFSLSTSEMIKSALEPRLGPLKDEWKKEPKRAERSEDVKENLTVKQEELNQSEDKPQPTPSSKKALSKEDKEDVEEKPMDLDFKIEKEVSVAAQEPKVEPTLISTETAPAPIVSSQAAIGKKSGSRSLGKAIADDDDSSILARDLDLSDEDSDAEQTSEDTKTSASQSKRGKVIASSSGAPVKRVQSPASSSSASSSSDSSSESGGDDDDDDAAKKGQEEKEKPVEQKKSSERRLSSSSSNSGSDSSSGSGSEDDEEDEDEAKKEEGKSKEGSASKLIAERGEKTPSPNSRHGIVGPASVGTPSAILQDNSEASMSWRLDNFIHPSKKNSSSPANASPLKSVSPPTCHSAPPSVQPKEDSVTKTPDLARPRNLKEIGPCETMSFELRASKDTPDLASDDDNHADEEDDDDVDDDVFKRKNKINLSKKVSEPNKTLSSSSSSVQPKPRKSLSSVSHEGQKKTGSKESKSAIGLISPVKKQPDSADKNFVKRPSAITGSLSSSSKHKKSGSSSSSSSKKKPSKTKSSSDDEIDVVSYTPDEKNRHRLSPSPDKAVVGKSKEEVAKQLFNGDLSDSSDGDSKVSVSRGKNAPDLHIKHQRRKSKSKEPASNSSISSTSLPLESSTSTAAAKPSKKLPADSAVTLDHLESISRPPNLLSPLHSAYSPPLGASTKPLPSFQTSFSPAPAIPARPSASSIPPFVTLSRNDDGSSRPRIMIQIRSGCASEKVFQRLREKKEKRKSSGKTYTKEETKSSESVSRPLELDTSKEARVPPIPDTKLSSHHLSNSSSSKDSDAAVAAQNGELLSPPRTSSSSNSKSSPSSKSTKRKSDDSGSAGVKGGGGTSSVISSSAPYKIPKASKPSSKESSSLTSSETASASISKDSAYTGSHSSSNTASASSFTKSSKLTSSGSDSLPSVTSNKQSSSSAVKNLDFSEDSHTSSNGTLKVDNTKLTKRKTDIDEELAAKKTKVDLPTEKGVVSASAPVRKRRDSTASTSSRGSHNSSSSKKSRRSSTASNKNNSSNNNNNNNSLDKSNSHLPNGPEASNLPFNHYVNGNSSSTTSRAPSLSSSSTLPPNLPSPVPIETQLQSTDHYLSRAKEHKHHADNLKDKVAKFEPYLRSGLSFFLAGYSMEQNKRDLSTSYNMYNDTSNLLQYVIRMRANSSSNPESSDKERKLLVLIIRLRAYLNHRLYRLRKQEVSKLKKVIESEQNKPHSSTTAAPSSTSANATSGNKPHAPSPHQSNWNKNSTGTPSPMSPTPSPAGSVSSQGSCEIMSGKISNGTTNSTPTSMTSPSPGMVSIHQRLHTVTQKYFVLTNHMVKSLELWDQADAEGRGIEDFFTIVSNACGPLSFHSDPPVIVRYMKHALRLLNL